MTDEQRLVEHRRLLRELGSQFAVGDSPQERVLEAMSMIEHEMNGNGTRKITSSIWIHSESI